MALDLFSCRSKQASKERKIGWEKMVIDPGSSKLAIGRVQGAFVRVSSPAGTSAITLPRNF